MPARASYGVTRPGWLKKLLDDGTVVLGDPRNLENVPRKAEHRQMAPS